MFTCDEFGQKRHVNDMLSMCAHCIVVWYCIIYTACVLCITYYMAILEQQSIVVAICDTLWFMQRGSHIYMYYML